MCQDQQHSSQIKDLEVQIMSKSILELTLELMKEKRFLDRMKEIWGKKHGILRVKAKGRICKGDPVYWNDDGTVSSGYVSTGSISNEVLKSQWRRMGFS